MLLRRLFLSSTLYFHDVNDLGRCQLGLGLIREDFEETFRSRKKITKGNLLAWIEQPKYSLSFVESVQLLHWSIFHPHFFHVKTNNQERVLSECASLCVWVSERERREREWVCLIQRECHRVRDCTKEKEFGGMFDVCDCVHGVCVREGECVHERGDVSGKTKLAYRFLLSASNASISIDTSFPPRKKLKLTFDKEKIISGDLKNHSSTFLA